MANSPQVDVRAALGLVGDLLAKHNLLDQNPFQREDPRHELWVTASHRRQEGKAWISSKLLKRLPAENANPAEVRTWTLLCLSADFTTSAAEAWMNLSVENHKGTDAYIETLDVLVEYTLAIGQALAGTIWPNGDQKEKFLSELQIEVAQKRETWKESRLRYAREAEEKEKALISSNGGGPKSVSAANGGADKGASGQVPSAGPQVLSDEATVAAADRAARRRAVVMPILQRKRWKPGRLATEAGVGKNSVYRYLDGTRVWITKENRAALAEALELETEQLPL